MRPVLLALLVAVTIGLACGPFFHVAVFTYQRHPDLPRTDFLDGKLGVLLPSYARSYLVVAYRHLNGIGFDSREREQVLSYWSDRATGHWDHIDTDWQKRWLEARDRIAGIPHPAPSKLTQGAMSFDPETKSFVLNCANDAFRTALHTLEARSARFGTNSAPVRDWASAQTTVFANCDGLQKVEPPPAPAAAPELIRKDRDYQRAAAHFYSGDYPEAIDEFEAIARDTASPWHTLAPYLVARTQARMAGSAAEERTRQILADPALASTHGMTHALLRRVMVAQRDPEYFHSLSTLLTSKSQGDGLREELWEFARIYDKLTNDDRWYKPKPEKIQLAPLQRDDLPDWIASFQGFRPDASEHAFSRWRSTHKLHWLLAALSRAPAKGPHSADLIRDAAAVPHDSPAGLTAAFHAMRLLVDSGQGAAARPALDALLSGGHLPHSAVNLFKGLRMRVSPDLAGFLNFAQRVPVLITLDIDEAQQPGFDDYGTNSKFDATLPRFDADSAAVFNRVTPLSVWKQAVETGALGFNLQQHANLVTFTRAVMLKATGTAAAMAARLPKSAYTEAYQRESTQFAAAFLLLHHPESRPEIRDGIGRESPPGRIDSYRDNWWCAPVLKDAPPVPTVAFLSPHDRQAGEAEFLALTEASGGATFLGRIVLAYARAHAADPRVPEALHLAVRAHRFACDAATADSDNTRDCFRLLHQRYPTSEWTRKTPTWR